MEQITILYNNYVKNAPSNKATSALLEFLGTQLNMYAFMKVSDAMSAAMDAETETAFRAGFHCAVQLMLNSPR